MNKRVYYKPLPSDTPFYIILEVEQKKPIGFFTLKNGEIGSLFIDPKYRKKGYATALLKQLMKDNPKLVLVTHPKNISMQHILENLGFEKWLKYEYGVR